MIKKTTHVYVNNMNAGRYSVPLWASKTVQAHFTTGSRKLYKGGLILNKGGI